MTALAVVTEIVGVEERELRLWIASGWIKPEPAAESWEFHEVDIARTRLIAEMRRDLEIADDTMPILLSLIDQIYGLRRDLSALCAAVAAQPAEVRAAIAELLHRNGQAGDDVDR
jgi:chaperone modulatory protein CbpM